MTPRERRRAQLERADAYANLSIHIGSRASDYRLTVELHGASTAEGHELGDNLGLERQSDVPVDRDVAGLSIQRRWTAGPEDAQTVLVVHHPSRWARRGL